MRTQSRPLTPLLAATLGLALAACGVEPTNPALGTSALTVENGVKLNGVKLNGVKLNGVKLNGSVLEGVDAAGLIATGAALVGAELEGQLSDGTTLRMRVDSAVPGASPSEDVTYYKISYRSDESWEPLCGRDTAGKKVTAVALSGTWSDAQGVVGGGAWTNDPAVFTFACTSAALGKCVDWGYKPWARATQCSWSGCRVDSLGPYHRACVRMARADYCGDGRSWTVDGTAVNVYDGVLRNWDTESWRVEAEWDENGARCVGSTRVLTTVATFAAATSCGSKTVAYCGGYHHFLDGTLLISECVNDAMETASTVTSSPVSFQ